MSPEQVLGKSVDHRTDFFSLGIVLYELVTQKLPFQGNSAIEMADAIINKPPVSINDLNRQVPAGLVKVILKMLEKDPAARYQKAEEACDRLAKA